MLARSVPREFYPLCIFVIVIPAIHESVNGAKYKLTHPVSVKSKISWFYEINIVLIPLSHLSDFPISDKSVHLLFFVVIVQKLFGVYDQ